MRPLRDVGRNSIIILVITLATAFLIAAASDLAEMESGGTLTYSWLNSLREAVVNIEEVPGIVKMDGAGTPSAATAGIDYQSPTTIPILQWYTATAYSTDTDAINRVVYNDGIIYKCILSHTSGATDDEPGTGATWQTYWQAGGSGFDAANPGDIGGTTPATNIKADIIEMTRNASTGDGWQFREGSNNGDNYTEIKGENNQQTTESLTVFNKDGYSRIGPPYINTHKSANHNAFLQYGEWDIISFSGAGTEISLDDVTNLSTGVIYFHSTDAEDKTIKPWSTDSIYYEAANALTTLGDGNAIKVTDVGSLVLYKRPDGVGWNVMMDDLDITDGGAETSGYNPGLLTDANVTGLYLWESGALITDSSTAAGFGLTSNGSPVADTDAGDYKEGSQSVYLASASYYSRSGSVDDFGWDSSQALSVTGWFKATSSEGNNTQLFTKILTDKKALVIYYTTASKFAFAVDGNDDNTLEVYTHATACTDTQWYHFALTIDAGTDAYRLRIWDDTAGDILGSDLTSTLSAGIANLDQNADFYIGASAGYNAIGHYDEFTFWDKVLSTTEIDQIRAGTYGQ